MELSKLEPVQTTSAGIETFLGYNHNLRIANGEFYDMENLSPDNYPVMTPCKRRERYWPAGMSEDLQKKILETGSQKDGYKIYGMISHGGILYYVVRHPGGTGYLYKEGVSDAVMELGSGNNDVSRTLIANGAYILVFPDNMYYNTQDPDDKGKMGMDKYFAEKDNKKVNWYPYDPNQKTYYTVYKGSATGEGLMLSKYTDDDASEDNITAQLVYKQYVEKDDGSSEYETILTPITSIYACVEFPMTPPETIGQYIRKGDAVEFTCGSWPELNGTYTVEDVLADGYRIIINIPDAGKFFLKLYNNSTETAGKKVSIVTTAVRIKRTVPKMDIVLECNNRIWGCKYGNIAGENEPPNIVNEIYACKQGDFRNWNVFAGVSTDSYVASVGVAGPFTGAINFNGRPLFFKENHYWLVSGDYPSQYGYTDAPIIGPKLYVTQVSQSQINNERSLVMNDRLLYYYAYDGIRVFDGYNSTKISDPLGKPNFKRCISGVYGNKLYFSMQDEQSEMFVYDTGKGLWYREKSFTNNGFCNHNNKLYAFVTTGIHDMEAADSEGVSWYGETGDLLPSLGYKYLHQLSVRMNVPEGASVWISLQYDASGKWEEVFRQNATKQRFLTVPIKPRRCDHLRMRIEGVGPVEVYAINKVYEQGSDV